MGEAVSEAFYQNIRNYIQQERLTPQNYKLQIKIHHNGNGNNVWTSSPMMPVNDWMENSQLTRDWLQTLANQLNSSQTMDPSHKDFFAELTVVHTPNKGGRYKKYNIKSLSYEAMLKKKQSILTIRNKDELCCARAIVTLKARIEKDSQDTNLRKGMPIPTRLAKLLYEEAGVAEGPCGKEELNAFQAVLAPTYQLIVVEGLKGHIIFKNQMFDNAPEMLPLLKINTHYHAITSLPAFLNRTYFCRHCEKAYNEETASAHNCRGQNCPACKRKDKKCPNFVTWETPTILCAECHCKFYGQACFDSHKTGKRSVCKRVMKCPECCKVYKRSKTHVCYSTVCGNCGQYRDVQHQCFIQPYKVKKADTETEAGEYMESESEDGELAAVRKPDPLIVAFDIECAANEIEGSKVFKPVLIGWSYLGEPDDYHEAAIIAEFLSEMQSKTNYMGEERQVFSFAHNLRAFDGFFIQEELYSRGHIITGILHQGAKYLSFESENLIFRDSLNFFSMPLEKLSATFNLRELHKGYFSYSWISEKNANYVGEFPPAKDYNPDRMSDKRRKEFFTWYQQQQGKEFNYRKELSLYLKSDVWVLREALQSFASEMYSLTGVQPLTQCVTIASTAFRVWQQNFLEPNLIALEPQAGWRSNRVKQSNVALEWLSFENAKLGGGIRVSTSLAI